MSPYEIKLLLDIYTMPHFKEGRNEPIFDSTIADFEKHGLVDMSSALVMTEKGRAHVIQLCNLLYPVSQSFWIDQFGNKIPDTI